ncbi:MAG: tetratricopeptide repeat protein [Pseudomonadota bacterium]|nr:tetratricopeptide repeat protein [Pseudomonadota bacterium]
MKSVSGLRASTAVLLVLGLAVLAGCARDRMATGSVRSGPSAQVAQLSVSELNALVNAQGAKYQRDPRDKATGLYYASLLRMTGRDEQALAVMRQMVIHHPKDNDVLSAYGKALAATGNFVQALDAIERSLRPDQPDWRLLSAKGAILDQLEKSEQAREVYRKALEIAPNEPSILSNLGMSYLLSNDLPAAETYLRKANAQPGADSRIRQNLALVVGLQGRFEEAERIASAELPAAEAQDNIAYLRKMLTQQNAWNQLRAEDGQPPQ